MRLAGVAFVAAISLTKPSAAAEPRVARDEAVMSGPILPARLAPKPWHFWRIGLGLERFGTGFEGSDYLAALAVSLRYRAFTPNLLLLAKPRLGTDDYEKSRFVLGLGLRSYVRLWSMDFGYGCGVQGELRFEDHFWLIHATPLELSAVVYRKHTLDIEVFLGARAAATGHLIDSFLLDPNGFHNESAQAELDRATGSDRVHGFLRVVVSRRLD